MYAVWKRNILCDHQIHNMDPEALTGGLVGVVLFVFLTKRNNESEKAAARHLTPSQGAPPDINK